MIRKMNTVALLMLLWTLGGQFSLSAQSAVLSGTDGLSKVAGKAERGQSPAATILVFLTPDCPICQKQTLFLRQLQARFADQHVQVKGIVPGDVYSKRSIRQFARKYRLKFPIYLDEDMLMVRMLEAEVVPEVFVFNAKGTLTYRGAVNDWFYELGRNKPEPQQHFAEDALQAALDGEPAPVTRTTAVGCAINLEEHIRQ